jgi:hypothetical protein
MAYTLETVLSEKIETVLARGTANTRMRDFYDIFVLESLFAIDGNILKTAFTNTSENRGSAAVVADMGLTLSEVESSPEMITLWKNYQKKFDYASDIAWDKVIQAVRRMCIIVNS